VRSLTPKLTPKKKAITGSELRAKMISIMRATPTISRAELADLCGIQLAGIKYHLRIMKDEMGIHWEGSSKTGRWFFPE
jgi:predicted HTH transcriptional regulator